MTRTGHTSVIRRAFKGLDQEAVDMLRSVAVKRTYPPSTVLCREGDLADTFYVITTGRVIITHELEGTDEDFVLGFMSANDFFGEMGLIAEERRAATVTTVVETEVLEITKEHFDRILASSPAMARSILNMLIRMVQETDKRAIEDLEKRYQELADAYSALEAAQSDRIAKAALEAQLEVAAKAQRSLLPSALPDVPGYQFAAQFEPARHIGGDFYDVREQEDGTISLLLADVSDKGPHAAIFMAVARTLFLTEARYHKQPAEVLQAVHRGLVDSSAYDMFVTAVYGILDPQTGVFRYVRGGHDEPVLARSDGSCEFLGGKGRFLGMWPDGTPDFEEQHITLHSGDCLVIYSDGVTDMRDPAGEPFSARRLARLVQEIRHLDASQIAQSIYENVQQHRKQALAFDDFTLLVLRAG